MIALISSICGDWVGLYIDGKLIKEGHSIGEIELLAIAVTYADKFKDATIYHGGISDECLEEFGYRMPHKLSNVVYDEDYPRTAL